MSRRCRIAAQRVEFLGEVAQSFCTPDRGGQVYVRRVAPVPSGPPDAPGAGAGVQCSLQGYHRQFLEGAQTGAGEFGSSPRHGLRALTLSSACPIPGSGGDSNAAPKGGDVSLNCP